MTKMASLRSLNGMLTTSWLHTCQESPPSGKFSSTALVTSKICNLYFSAGKQDFDAGKCQISFQLNDSSLIISILRTYLLKQDSLEQLLNYYPPITVEGSNDKKTVEYANRYGIMYKHDFSESELREIK